LQKGIVSGDGKTLEQTFGQEMKKEQIGECFRSEDERPTPAPLTRRSLSDYGAQVNTDSRARLGGLGQTK